MESFLYYFKHIEEGSMRSRFAKLFNGVLGLVLVLSALGVAAPAPVTADGVTLPSYAQLVQDAASQEWLQQPGSQKTGPVSVIVHVGMSPLAMVGKNWSHQQRVDYVAQIRAAQDALAPQIEALGGKIRGRFAHLSTGLAVDIDASQVDALRGLGSVIAVRGVAKYELDLTETVAWIGASAVQSLGVTGEGVDVAVLDSGVDYAHAKFGGPGTLAAYNTAYCGAPGTAADPFDPACTAHDFPDVTGMFGDSAYGRDGSPDNKVVGGWDWVGDEWPFGPTSSDANPIDCGGTPFCDGGHGTHVADIIGGLESAPAAGDAGVAPGANIWMFKVCSSVSTSCEGLALLLAMDDAMDLDDSDYGACTPGVDAYCLDYDPADVINMSLGSLYGQPEDDLTLFSNIASYYGSLVVASAGNSGDRPYIVGSPSAAEGALSVAQSTVPSDKFYAISAGAVTVGGVLQPWSPAVVGSYSGVLQYGNGAGGNKNGCAAFPAGSLTGKVLLVDRGTCNISIKGANGSAGGAAFVIIANNAFSNTPPSFSYGGGTITVPTLTVTLNDGAALKTVLGSTASLSETGFALLQDDIVASSSRGPRIADGDIKPDIAAPGASVSAEVGTGTGKTAFGGTSGAAPIASGAAALLVEALEDRGVLDTDPGLDGQVSFAPFLKSLLMNTANPNAKIGGNFLAPITLQGAGRVDALSAFNSGTIAMDVTGLYDWLFTGTDAPCTATPTDVWGFLFLGAGVLDCANDYPYGNDFFNAWNSQTGSLSFGYDGVSSSHTESRKVLIWNASAGSKTYNLSSAFRYSNDAAKGVTLTASPSSLTVPAGGLAMVNVTMKINASALRDWTLNAGSFGNAGTNIYCFNPNPQNGCPTLTMFEVDGFLTINGGAGNTVRMPWQVLPKKAANTKVASHTASSVKLSNSAKYKPGDTDVFSLVDISPNNCEIVDGFGDCLEANYVPGILPGINTTAIDIHEVGVRSYQAAGLNASLGLPAAPAGAINDEVVEFGLTVYDAPYRASHNFPVEFDIYVDSNSDGVDDYVVFNFDVALTGGDGRNAVFVADINPANGTRPLRPYFFSVTNFNSQNWILSVPAAAIDAVSTKSISFFVLAFDAYFTGSLWDCSPFNSGLCGGAYHSYTTGSPKFRPVTTSLQVPKLGSYTLPYSTSASGKSPSQTGLLFMYRDAKVGAESESVTLP